MTGVMVQCIQPECGRSWVRSGQTKDYENGIRCFTNKTEVVLSTITLTIFFSFKVLEDYVEVTVLGSKVMNDMEPGLLFC